ncbi:YbaB/EbfC family nucleoid-associated protein [Pseudonocardia kujensis]|uniref:YbaB/EbfC family nucleoid-associated protein n=1 Tax=Pseudonocardia kujensis TaxID=1128675 RepID=UPI001E4126B8|nr:YbaB/EbfC family nucleoid-associated protein [Pseudonocardia kujensis]MCE0768375.1 YbaB/EbfC family nucleoid-associated protein [Pseudonocardia kujensis]
MSVLGSSVPQSGVLGSGVFGSGVLGDGQAWLADYRHRIEELRGRAERAQDEIAGLTATAVSADGAVRATVDSTGALTGLTFGPAADGLGRSALAELVVTTAADATAEVSRRATAALGPLLEQQ